MNQSYARVVACGAFLLLGACGGGGGSSLLPIPTPPPPPPAVANAFPLTTSATFNTVRTRHTYNVNPTNGSVTVGGIGAEGMGSTVTISYDAASGTYTVLDSQVALSASFSAVDRTISADVVDTYTKQAGTVSNVLKLYSNVRSGASQNGSPVHLTYLSYGIWSRTDSQSGDKRKTYFLFGYPTVTADVPRTGSANYLTAVTGHMLEAGPAFPTQETELGGSATFTANFGAGTVNTELTLLRLPTQTTVGTFSGSGTLNGEQFLGTFTAPFFDGGSFMGSFFGPQVNEMGYSFAITRFIPDPFAGATVLPMHTRISGLVVGQKQ